MRKPKKPYPRRCALCTDNRKRKVYYFYPMGDNPKQGELRCTKHAPNPVPWLLGLDKDGHEIAGA